MGLNKGCIPFKYTLPLNAFPCLSRLASTYKFKQQNSKDLDINFSCEFILVNKFRSEISMSASHFCPLMQALSWNKFG